MNLLESIRKSLSLKDAQKASSDYKIIVQEFMTSMQREKDLLCIEYFNKDMKKQIRKNDSRK